MKPATVQRALHAACAALCAALLTATVSVAGTSPCGDGVPSTFEQCDDGNTVDGDCCDSNCQLESNGSPCEADTDQCTADVCDGEGTCTHFIDQGADCDDGSSCTSFDFCNSDGICTGGEIAPDDSECPDANLCGGFGTCTSGFCFGDPADCDGFGGLCQPATCDTEQRRCIVTTDPDGTPCDDGGVCTDPGECNGGECFLQPRDCSQFDDDCHVGLCEPELGGCFAATQENGTSCGGACIIEGNCQQGQCIGTPVDCSAFADQCNDGACDRETGCFTDPVQDGAECGDGSSCTTNDQCSNGTCAGTPLDCSESSDQCNVGVCDEQSGRCVPSPVAGTPACNDGAACTVNDTCSNGVCQGQQKDCSAFSDQCNVGTCVPQTGQCVGVDEENGTTCNDGNACTTNDQCTNGVCAGTPVDCSNLDNACHVGVCNAQSGQCQSQNRQNGTTCNDGNACTLTDQCTNGTCAGTARDCSTFTDQCHTGTCSTETGQCFAQNKTNGTTCSDGNLCTLTDQCTNGTCAGTARDCSNLTDQCHTGTCSTTNGQCFAANKQNGTTCSDGNLCTLTDQCTNGTCAGAARDCSSFTDQCHTGTCSTETGQCFAATKQNGTTCSDGNLCTLTDQCTNGTCAGTARDCSNLTDACHIGACSTTNGQCVANNRENGTTCSDGNLCTLGDQCTNGTCGGTARDCSNLTDQCHVGACSTTSGECVASNRTNGTTCSDGNLCTLGDQCTNGTCGGTARDCSNLTDQCHIGACSTTSGQCVANTRENGTTCNDGLLCTLNDQCTGGVCGGPVRDCSKLDDACHAGVCSPTTGNCVAENQPNGTICNDGSACTTSDVCAGGTCSGTNVDCSGLTDGCHVGTCNPDNGACNAVNRTNGTGCSDGNPCTSPDTCTAGSCAGPGVDCSTLNAPCRTGVCNARTGACEAIASGNGAPCTDGAFCTMTDACQDGACVGAGNPCAGNPACSSVCNEAADACRTPAGTACQADTNPCTDDVCDGAGNCTGQPNDDACDDGQFCTSGDHCVDAACVGDPTCPPTQACGDTCDEENDACRTCGHPFSNTRCVVNAIFVLQGALGLHECDVCTCDVDSNGIISVTDALMILRTCANLPTELDCPAPVTTTTIGI